ncbi:MAG: Gfo/Idh/MocA family oxidoreductase, partial [Planctomycetes bacterium]|nr:Gfo/Idh/MocA family oxidoreductase [Planctomycetota bacterium]
EEIAKEFKVKKAYTRERDLLKDPDVDAVYIASPVNVHLKQIKMAAAAGKHILCEKPLTMSLKQAKEAIAVCKKNKVILQEGYMMKFHGAHQKIAELIKQKKIGKVVYMRAQLACWYPPIKGAWRQDPRTGGGGSLVDMATHLYDLLESFAGPVKRVGAITGNQVQKYKSEDSATLILEFASGAHASIDSFFCVPDEASRTRLEIYGSKGAILTEGTIGQGTGGKLEGIFGLGSGGYAAAQSKDKAPEFKDIAFPNVNPYTAECEYFADCVLKKRQPKINGVDSILHITNLTEKAYAASKQNRILTV